MLLSTNHPLFPIISASAAQSGGDLPGKLNIPPTLPILELNRSVTMADFTVKVDLSGAIPSASVVSDKGVGTLAIDDVKSSVITDIRNGESVIRIPLSNTGNPDPIKLRHNLVGSAIYESAGVQMDTPLTSIAVMNDHTDRKTPDFIFKIANRPNVFYVLEVKSAEPRNLEDYYLSTREYYKDALLSRAERAGLTIHYFTICVTDRRVITNLNLQGRDDIITNLCVHFQIGQLIELACLGSGWRKPMNTVSDADVVGYQSSIRDAGHPSLLPETSQIPIISQALDKHWAKEIKHVEDNYTGIQDLLCRQYLSTCARASKEWNRRSLKDGPAAFREQWDNIPDLKHDSTKKVVSLPLLKCTCEPFVDDELPDYPALHGDHMALQIWQEYIRDAKTRSERWQTDYDKYKFDAMNPKDYSDTKDSLRNKFKRAQIYESLETQNYLASRGVGTKRNHLTNSALIEAQHKESQRPISRRSNTDDIASFIHTGWDELSKEVEWTQPSEEWLKKFKRVSDDVERSSNLKMERDYSETFRTKYKRTQLYESTTIMSAILSELSVSMAQKTTSSECVLKRLRHYPIWMLTKSTKASGPIFFSLLWKRSSIVEVFEDTDPRYGVFQRAIHSDSGWSCTEFCTYTRVDIDELLSINQTLMGVLATWCDSGLLRHDEFFDGGNLEMRKFIERHFMASILKELDVNHKLSENLQQTRYMYMSAFQGKMLINQWPDKGLKKFDPRMYSRYSVFCMNGILKVMEMMKESPPIFGRDRLRSEDDSTRLEKSGEIISNCPSYIDFSHVPNMRMVLCLSYMGYLHNSDKAQDKMHGLTAIFDKIIKLEIPMHDGTSRPDYMGSASTSDLDELREHEFSLRHVLFANIYMKRVVKGKVGANFDEWFKKRMLTQWERTLTEEFATLKSSIQVKTSDHYAPDEKDERRMKCIEAIWKELGNLKTLRPFGILPWLLDQIDQMGGNIAEEFRKNQIGGSREIFILHIYCRLSIKFLETMAQVIAEAIDHEYMTKGEASTGVIGKHYSNVVQMKRENPGCKIDMEVSVSADMATWCQKFVMTMFGAMFKVWLPEGDGYLGVAYRILNHHTNKKLYLPKELLDLFYMNPDIDSFREPTMELKRQFLGQSESTFMRPFTRYMSNTSNFAQGIMGYTSTLYHAAIVGVQEDIIKRLLTRFENNYNSQKSKGEKPVKIGYHLTSMVTSDDWGRIQTVTCNNVDDALIVDRTNQFLCLGSLYFCNFFGVSMSWEKSFFSTAGAFEFKSKFFAGNTMVMPLIKLSHAALTTAIKADSVKRQQIGSTLLSQVLENGGSFLLTQTLQDCQEARYYESFGLHLHDPPIMEWILEMITRKPHHTLCLFLREPICPGMFGFQFSHYLYANYCPEFNLVDNFLYTKDGVDVDQDGHPIYRIFLTQGFQRNYFDMLSRMGVGKEIRDDLNANIGITLTGAKTLDDLKIIVGNKFFAPGVAEELAGKHYQSIHALGFYCWRFPCVSVLDKSEEHLYKKMTMPQVYDSIILGSPLSNNMMNTIFSNRDFFSSVISQLRAFTNAIITKLSWPKPVRSVTMRLPSRISVTSASFTDIIMWKWGIGDQQRIRSTVYELQTGWTVYCQRFPWLRDTIDQTVTEGRFVDRVALIDFVKAQSPKERSVTVMIPSRSNLPFLNLVQEIVRTGYMLGHTLVYPGQAMNDDVNINYTSSLLMLILHGPTTDQRIKNDRARYLLKHSRPLIQGDDIEQFSKNLSTVSEKESHLAVIQRFIQKREGMTSQDLMSLIIGSKRGVWGFYSMPQQRVVSQTYDPKMSKYVTKVVYTGVGTYKTYLDGDIIEFNIMDKKLTSISVSEHYVRAQKLRYLYKYWKRLVQELNVDGSNLDAEEEMIIAAYVEWDTGSITNVRSMKRLPVIISDNLHVPNLDPANVSMEINNVHGLRLSMRGAGVNANELITIMSYQPSLVTFNETSGSRYPGYWIMEFQNGFQRQVDGDLRKPLWQSWMKFEKMGIDESLGIIESLIANAADGPNHVWIRNILIERSMLKGWKANNLSEVAFQAQQSCQSCEMESESISEDDTMDIYAGLFGLGTTDLVDPIVIGDITNVDTTDKSDDLMDIFTNIGGATDEFLNDLNYDMDNLYEALMHEPTRTNLNIRIQSIHPIFDNILDTMWALDSKLAANIILGSYYCALTSDDRLIGTIYRLFGVNNRPRRPMVAMTYRVQQGDYEFDQ